MTADTSIQAPPLPRRVRVRRAMLPVLVFSLAVTACCAVLAAGVHVAIGTRFLLAFVLLRWSVVGALLVTPLAHQALVRASGSRLRLPALVATPLAALFMTCESIVVDVISARLH